MKKTNRTKNSEHEQKQLRKQRPKEPHWDFFGLDEIIRQWVQK